MTLCRTKSGLANKHILLSVDVVAFVEGGEASYDLQSVIDGMYNISSDDIIFWQIILSLFKPDLKIHFYAVGCKDTIKKISEIINENSIETCLAFMDRDFDSIESCISDQSHCTFGYSWETDVFNEDVINETIISLARIGRYQYKMYSFVRYYLDLFKINMRASVFLDKQLHNVNDSFIPRTSTGKGILDNNKPVINQDKIKSLAKLKKNSIDSSKENKPLNVDVVSDCYGHFYFHYVCNFIYYIVNKVLKGRIQKSMIKVVAIEKFSGWLRRNQQSELYSHYSLL